MPRPLSLLPIQFILMPSLAGADTQSTLDPKGDRAREIAEIGEVMFVGAGMIFLLVAILVLLALFGGSGTRAYLGRPALIVLGGIAFPLVVLSALLVYSLSTASSLVTANTPPALRIEVAGELWWWRVRYLDERGEPVFETANELRIPAGREVALILTSDNVIHSFWVPSLAGKVDMIPGHVNRLHVRADAPGVYRGQCAEFCGAQHARMALHVIALEPDKYDAWHAGQRRSPSLPTGADALRGSEVFMRNGCGACHTVRGTSAAGTSGPDLTHVGGRHALAAATLGNTVGAFGGWVAASQHVKPGNRMPSFGHLKPDELRALAAYLEALK